MAQITEFGKEVKKRLIDMDKKQTWLIEEVRARTGLYFDDSYLSKIFTGKLETPGIIQALREAVGLRDEQEQDGLCEEDAAAIAEIAERHKMKNQ